MTSGVPPSGDAIRRAVDVLVAGLGLVATTPLLAIAAIGTRVTAGRGVLFRQWRLGRGGRPFRLLKFRTMRHAEPGRDDPAHDDERITRFGAFLRRTSLDELPSLWNLARGDVTLVGPRPLPVHYWARFRGDEYERFHVRPGITGLAQVRGRNALGWDERLALDVAYVRERRLLGDLRILVQTVPVVLGGGGVDQAGGVTMTELPADRPSRDPDRTAAPGDAGRAPGVEA